MKKIIVLFIFGILLAQNAYATVRISGNNVIRVFVQSLSVANVHFIETQNQAWATCPFNRAYIDPADKELIAKALTAEANGKQVGVSYEDAAPPKVASPHGIGTCKILSIW